MNNRLYQFEAEMKKVPDIDGAYVEFPYDAREEFGKGRVAVIATFDEKSYNGNLVRMQTPCHITGICKDIRAGLSLMIISTKLVYKLFIKK